MTEIIWNFLNIVDYVTLPPALSCSLYDVIEGCPPKNQYENCNNKYFNVTYEKMMNFAVESFVCKHLSDMIYRFYLAFLFISSE